MAEQIKKVISQVEIFKKDPERVFEDTWLAAIREGRYQGFWIGSLLTGSGIVFVVWLMENYFK